MASLLDETRWKTPVVRWLVVLSSLFIISTTAGAASAETPVFVGKWGSQGSGDGEFLNPNAIAVDAAGNIYVADTGNDRIQKFSSNGVFLGKWGSQGAGDGQFQGPVGIAVDAAGNVYVADHGNHRIQKFSSNGVFLGKWGVLGVGDGQFVSVFGVAVDVAGNVYVAEGNHRIQKFSNSGTFLGKWGSFGTDDGQFQSPVGIAVDSAGNVYVSDNGNHRIQRFSSSGTFLGRWGSQGGADGQFISPRGIAVDAVGNVYVADYWCYRIQKFSSVGVFVGGWGSYGTGDGQLAGPVAVAVPVPGINYVLDDHYWNTDGHRIQMFSTNFSPVESFAGRIYISGSTANPVAGIMNTALYLDPLSSERYENMCQNDPSSPLCNVLPQNSFTFNGASIKTGESGIEVRGTCIESRDDEDDYCDGDRHYAKTNYSILLYPTTGLYLDTHDFFATNTVYIRPKVNGSLHLDGMYRAKPSSEVKVGLPFNIDECYQWAYGTARASYDSEIAMSLEYPVRVTYRPQTASNYPELLIAPSNQSTLHIDSAMIQTVGVHVDFDLDYIDTWPLDFGIPLPLPWSTLLQMGTEIAEPWFERYATLLVKAIWQDLDGKTIPVSNADAITYTLPSESELREIIVPLLIKHYNIDRPYACDDIMADPARALLNFIFNNEQEIAAYLAQCSRYVNSAPSLSVATDQTAREGEPLTFTITAADPDRYDALTIQTSNLPPGATFTVNGGNPATGLFSWTPGYDQTGNYPVLFTLTDNGAPALSVSHSVTISVGNVNRPPKLVPIGNKSVDEGGSITFLVSGWDPDGNQLIYSASDLPTGANFDPVTQVFYWVPDFCQAGKYEILFTVTDNGEPALSTSESVLLTVGNMVNHSPVLNPIGNKFVKEGEYLIFWPQGTDPDGNRLTYSANNLPAGARFIPGIASGTFSWSPGYDQAGVYTIVFTVTDNGEPMMSASESVTITVGKVNRPPSLNPIANKVVNEGGGISFLVSGWDFDGDTITYSASGLPPGAVFDPVTRLFTWRPNYDQAGNYSIVFTATDNGEPALSASATAAITVVHVNGPPKLNRIGYKTVNEGELLQFTVTATDPDGDVLTYSAGNLPAGATFDPPTRLFSWTPNYTQGDWNVGGSYPALFTVTDSGTPPESASEWISIRVVNVNRPPVMNPIGNKTGNEKEPLEFTVTATDPDGDALTYTAGNLPTGAYLSSFTGVFTWWPDYTQAGSYQDVIITVTDSGTPPASASETITITVGNVNRPPSLGWWQNLQVREGALLRFTVHATDPDGDALAFSAGYLPAGAGFDPATQVFSWIPDYTQAGNFQILFTATDNGVPPASDTKTTNITVGNVNRRPVLTPIGSQTVKEGELLEFTVTATDPDGDGLIYSAGNLPAGATFDPATQVFSWIPDYTQADNYREVTFWVYDNGTPPAYALEMITITVGNVNRPPVLNPIGNRTVNEGELLQFTVTATDPDGDGLTYLTRNLPADASFDPVSQVFSWTPDFTQAGSHQGVVFTVQDFGTPTATDAEAITITVANVNHFITFTGFFQPVDNIPMVNVVKNGSTVPVKWKLRDEGGTDITDVNAVASITAGRLSCANLEGQPEEMIAVAGTGGSTLRYDFDSMQFILNWKTPNKPNTCYRLDVKFTDNSIKSAYFRLK